MKQNLKCRFKIDKWFTLTLSAALYSVKYANAVARNTSFTKLREEKTPSQGRPSFFSKADLKPKGFTLGSVFTLWTLRWI